MYNIASKNGAQHCELGTFSTFCASFGGLESSNVTSVSRECAPAFPYRLQNLAYVSPRRSLCWKSQAVALWRLLSLTIVQLCYVRF